MAHYNPPLRLAPSILSADFSQLGQEVSDVIRAGADWVHFDVMDNHFVPNLTIGPLVLESLRKATTAPIDVHLMVENPETLIPQFAKAGADYITFHVEATPHIDRVLSQIKELGVKAGIVFNPATPVDALRHVIEKVDLVLLMSVNPGFGGQKFIASTLSKAIALRNLFEEHYTATGHEILLEMDGGISPENATLVTEAGVNVVVAGSAVFKHRSATGYRDIVNAMKDAMNKGKEEREYQIEQEMIRNSGP